MKDWNEITVIILRNFRVLKDKSIVSIDYRYTIHLIKLTRDFTM